MRALMILMVLASPATAADNERMMKERERAIERTHTLCRDGDARCFSRTLPEMLFAICAEYDSDADAADCLRDRARFWLKNEAG